MAKQNSIGLPVTINADGFDLAGGNTQRKLTVTGGDVTITGGGTIADGDLLIGDSSNSKLSKATLTAGSGISITNGAGSISLATNDSVIVNNKGWVNAGETWTYSSVDDPTGVLTVPSDATTKYSTGMRIKFTNGGNTIYGIITAVTSTTITFLHEINPADSQALHLMANSTITSPSFSPVKAPFGFPQSPLKWTVKVVNTLNHTVTGTVGSWFNIGSISIDVPIGDWYLEYSGAFNGYNSTGASGWTQTLSTSATTESDPEFSSFFYILVTTALFQSSQVGKFISTSSKTKYYINMKSYVAENSLRLDGSKQPTIIKAVSANL